MNTRYRILGSIVEKSGVSYNSVILTTFSFDPVFFNSYYMPKLRAVNATNILVLIDADRYDEAMELIYGEDGLASNNTSLSFTPIRVKSRGNGVFHPKVALFVGESKCMALVGSGNLTCGGTSYNEEVWNAFCADSPTSAEAPIINAVWQYINLLIGDDSENVKEQLKWVTNFSELMRGISESGKTVFDNDEEHISLLFNEPSSSIFAQLLAAMDGVFVKKISMLAPYYDTNGRAIAALIDSFNPEVVDCFIDNERGMLPTGLPASYIDRISFHKIKEDRTHAKILQLESELETWVLTGSANITQAALGLDGQPGNEEASILLRVKGRVDYINELGFEKSPIDILSIARKSGNKTLSASHKEVSIRSCELWEGTYRLKLNKDVDDVDICIYHLAGVPSIHHFERLTSVQEMPVTLMQDAISLVLQRDGLNISNRIYILDQERIQKGCPDKVIKQLADLFGKSEATNWWNKISGILGNVYVDDSSSSIKDSAGRIVARASKGKEDTSSEEESLVYAADYDKVVFKQDGYSSRINQRIFDFIFSGMRQVFEAEESDEKNSVKDVEDGKAAQAEKKKRVYIVHSPSAIKAAFNYLERLDKKYLAPLKEFDSTNLIPITLDPDPYRKGYPPLPATLTHYSAILVAVALMMRVSNDNEEEKKNDVDGRIQYYALRLLNRFALTFRRSFTVSQEYRSIQLQRMQRELFAHSLILLAHFRWDVWKLTVTVLNLCDSFAPDHPEMLQQAVSVFENEIKEDYMSLNSTTLAYILRLLAMFKTDGGMCEVNLVASAPEKFIYYNRKVGYLICDSVTRGFGKVPYFGHIITPALKEGEIEKVYIPEKVRMFPADLHNIR
jgi:HKD family nuclease